MPASTDSPLARWTVPECPFAVEYDRRVLDDVRLAVVDAFFSLPRGGAEIGGILLGRQEEGRVTITESMALECEHAFGPSFTLSETDRLRFGEMIAASGRNPHSRPVGWYHSHTRSEIFLSEADQEIHRHFFPEPWQVALVLKPHTFLPARAGFFFRGRDGAIRGDACLQEFTLDPLPVRPLPSTEPVAETPARPEPNGRVIDVTRAADDEAPAAIRPEPGPPPAAATAPEAVPPPAFLAAQPPSSRRWVWIVAVVLGLAAGAAGYQTRQKWAPQVGAWFRSTSPVAQASAGLSTVDRSGQLQILWDGNSPDVRRSAGGMLLITDGQEAHPIPLDAAHLQAGSLTYVRQSERVDVTLTLGQPNGQKLVQTSSFLGKLPAALAPAAGGAALQTGRDGLAGENARLKAALARETERSQQLQKSLDDTRKALQRERQRKRLENQDTAK
jgi:proteasome lid subunit RPN8/RPN11